MTAVAIEHVSYFDVLEMVCKRQGWAAVLRSDGDGLVEHLRATHDSQLTYLDIVDLGDGASRRSRILAGELVVRVQFVYGPSSLETAAVEALDMLGERGLIDWKRDA